MKGTNPPAPDVAGCSSSQASLLAHLHSLQGVSPAQASRLTGWSVGHLLTHIARNADSYRALLDGKPQYDGGWDRRNADIATGADRDWSALVNDVATSAAGLEAAFGDVEDWNRGVPMLTGAQPAQFLPQARRREVEVHRVDLDLGYEFEDVPAQFIEADGELLRRWWVAANRPAADLPDPVATLETRARWQWLLGRLEIPGVIPAGLF